MKYLLAFLAIGCAVETEGPITTAEVDDENQVIIVRGEPEQGSNPCSPAIYLEVDGVVHTIPSLCPMPAKPEPDPALEPNLQQGLEKEHVY